MKVYAKLVIILGLVLCLSLFHTFLQLNISRTNGVYTSPEQGMLAYAEKYYSANHEVQILYAGPTWDNGYQPYNWYVIAEIHASSRADGSEMRSNGCDAPGLAYLETKDGWVYVPDGAFPSFMGFWMNIFGLAGEGRSTSSIELLPPQTTFFCGSDDMVYYGH